MAQALIADPTDEMAIFVVTELVMQLPDDLRDGYCYWPLSQAITMQEGTIPLGPVREISYQFMRTPEDAEKIVLRHPCASCTAALDQAKEALRNNDFPGRVLCVAQCIVDYLRDVRKAGGAFHPGPRF